VLAERQTNAHLFSNLWFISTHAYFSGEWQRGERCISGEIMSTTGLLRSMKAKLGGNSSANKKNSSAEANDKDASPSAQTQSGFFSPTSTSGMSAGAPFGTLAGGGAGQHRNSQQNSSREAMLHAYKGKQSITNAKLSIHQLDLSYGIPFSQHRPHLSSLQTLCHLSEMHPQATAKNFSLGSYICAPTHLTLQTQH
jgi:hypothetical protein